MTRAIALALLLVGCGSATVAPSSEASGAGAARPVRLADHATETPEVEGEREAIPVTAAVDVDGVHADPPPVEPPSFED